MIEMRGHSLFVALAADRFLASQAAMNRDKEALDYALYEAFAKLCPFKSGDRITCAGRQGRAVILRNNTQLGLYLDNEGVRYPIPQPYKLHASLVRKPKKKVSRV